MFSQTVYRSDIQVLRGLAVLAVVLFHANESRFPLGYLGVDVFFVISGFVVTPSILRIFTDQPNFSGGGGRLASLRYFYKRRFYRLAPALAVTLVISAVAIFLFAPIADHDRFAKQGIATLLLVGNLGAYKFSGGDYFSPNPNPLVHTWSLSVEEQIYIVLPLILFLVLRNRSSPKRFTYGVFVFISALSFISFLFPTVLQPLYSGLGIEIGSQFSFYSLIDRIWQFTAGGLLFLWLDRYQKRAWKIPKVINLLMIITLFMILFAPFHINLSVGSLISSLFAVIVILSRSLDVLPSRLIYKLKWVGDRSYSIYLVHMPCLYLAKYSPATQIGNVENRTIQSTVAVVAAILLGALSYTKIENKFRDRSGSNFDGLKTLSASLILTIVLPLFLFVTITVGLKYKYWGLDKNISVPVDAGDLDPNCNRDVLSGPPCIYKTKSANKTVLLIGDSHARHISQAVIDSAKSQNWNAVIWTLSACHFQLEVSKPNEITEKCKNRNSEIYHWIKKNKINSVIVSQFVNAESTQSDLRNALSALRLLVPNILLVENNPIFPDEKDFMVSRPLVMSPYEAPKKFALLSMQFKDKNASNQLAIWARNNGIFTVNFDSIFCDRETCTRWSNAGWLYRDDDHFSVAGAELTIPKLSNFLKRF